jgi:putative ABC transport system ATP-binding protein
VTKDSSLYAVQCRNLCRHYQQGEQTIMGLDNVNIDIQDGEFICLTGPSGSGKTTLLNHLGGLDTPNSGELSIAGQSLSNLTPSELSDLRLNNIGFVFQSYNLIPVLSAIENIEFILMMQGVGTQRRRQQALAMLKEVGLQGLEHRRPAELSGGQQQRVAVARAIVSQPALVLADEPTANLDSVTAEQLLALFQNLNKKLNTTFVIASHDPRVQNYATRLIRMQDGKIIEDSASE